MPGNRARVILEAERWLRTPFASGQRVLGAGVDCAHLVIAVYHAAGLLPDVRPDIYPPDWHLHHDAERLLEHVGRYFRPTRDPVPGDLVTYRYGRAVAHAGILVAPGEIIHALHGIGVIRDAVDFAGAERFAGAWTLAAWAEAVAA